jgi:protein-S-isoprenylcysteine O-methyltransferase Ste14
MEPVFLAFIICVLGYNYAGLYTSHSHGAKVPKWPDIAKSRDVTYHLLYLSHLGVVLSAIFSLISAEHVNLLMLSGFALMVLAIWTNYIARRDLAEAWSPTSEAGDRLVTNGIYGRIRHPVYASLILFLTGALLIGLSAATLLFFVLFIAALAVRINREEKFLLEKFGEDYARYARKVPRFLPRITEKKGYMP